MADVTSLKNIYVYLNEICPDLDKVQYLGGLDLLVSFEDAESAQMFRFAAETMKEIFSLVSLWEGQSLGFERVAWLKVQGIPLHLVSNEVTDAVGGMIGKVMHKANRSESDRDLSFEYVGVLVEDGKRISEEIMLVWRNRKFRVWIVEEAGDWVPDFTKVPKNQDDENMASEESTEDDTTENQSEHSSEESDREDDSGSEVDPDVDQSMDPVDLVEPNVDQVQKGCVECPLNVINNEQLLTFKVTNVVEDFSADCFIPTAEFDFHHPIENAQNSPLFSNVFKRKKCKKAYVGRTSFNYISSNESQKLSKKPKNTLDEYLEEDVFWLNPLLGLDNNTPIPLDDNSMAASNNLFDLNSQPIPPFEESPANESGDHDEAEPASLPNEAPVLNEEIEATKLLGEKLGVSLGEHESLVQKSII
ncbi:hypothetical protein Hdeb2414_s0735g00941091 [Helianthus debilis subsp. tardiflorus]